MIRIRSLLFSLLITTSCCVAQNRPDPLQPPIPDLPQAQLSSVGMKKDTIARLIDLIRSTPPRDFRALVVIKDNKLVVEEYFNTYWRETIHDIRSAGKGITALLLGIAIDKGLVKSTEQSIYDFFPGKKFEVPDAAHKSIKIKHLLNMSSGLYVNDDDDNAPGNTANWLLKDNWVNFATSVPMTSSPGEKYVYADICPMLIGAIIEQTSGKKLSAFAKENLFDPLGIREFYWYTAPNGSTGPMGNLYLSAVDFAKIGQVVAGHGKWQGKKIVSESWIKEISAVNFDISNEGPFAQGYGTFWFKSTKNVDGKLYECLFASGNGGNLLFVVPGKNLVVSLLSSAYGGGHKRSHNIFEAVLRSLE
ncbi:beta-lactamase family protein [Fulvivirgaceae bacterium PWU4]|uniref:Beta-lactamase family protein n=1 Tax=Chryseosolibacter histidini TaxID=2782349 RepID=A0AAP2DNK5_9BACT|nr:serine hydrolase [Chryseosolibacter histidini]MBT1698157.1 beta-lactamase family protein [Chryseosolibacter histidini]